MAVRHYGLLNLGRDKNERRSTQRIDAAAIEEWLELVGDEQAALFGVEFNEGDDNNELGLARQILKGWTVYAGSPGRRVREPIFLSPDQDPARWHVKWVPGTAVQHWSPQRSVLRVDLQDEPESLVACHNAAGPHTAGDRPAWARGPLRESWDRSNRARLLTKRALHRAGRHVTELADLNHYRLSGLPGEVTVFHERTDYGFAYAAPGHQAHFRAGRSAKAGLDSHGIHTMHGTYRKERP
jgi:hypothetical protein